MEDQIKVKVRKKIVDREDDLVLTASARRGAHKTLKRNDYAVMIMPFWNAGDGCFDAPIVRNFSPLLGCSVQKAPG